MSTMNTRARERANVENDGEGKVMVCCVKPYGVFGDSHSSNVVFPSHVPHPHTHPPTHRYDYRSEINKDNFLGTGGKLVRAYADLMKKMWMDKTTVMAPNAFKRQLGTFAPQFAGYRQHDAQELLSFLLDGIHEDLNRVKKKPYIEDKDCDGTNDEQDAVDAWKNYLQRNRSLVVDIFQGQLRNTCVCRDCGHTNIRFEPFMYLSLPISAQCQTLEDCLQLYLDREDLTGDNQWYCEKCKKHVDATKKIDLWILPPILIIHLKRFIYDEFGRVGRKNSQALQHPLCQWDLTRFVRSRRGDTPQYDMYAVANHIGNTGGGHYTACALNRFDENWYEFNDSRYKRIDDPERQFGSSSSSPYLLFYNRSDFSSVESDHSLNGRVPLIRRQSVSRPELWPHAQVQEGRFRHFRRSVTSSTLDRDNLGGSASLLRETTATTVATETTAATIATTTTTTTTRDIQDESPYEISMQDSTTTAVEVQHSIRTEGLSALPMKQQSEGIMSMGPTAKPNVRRSGATATTTTTLTTTASTTTTATAAAASAATTRKSTGPKPSPLPGTTLTSSQRKKRSAPQPIPTELPPGVTTRKRRTKPTKKTKNRNGTKTR